MAVNKPGKAEILAAFFDDGTYSPLFTDGAVSAAYGCANGQNAYVVFEDGSPVGVQDIEKNIRVLEMAAETGAPVVTFYDSTGAKLEGGLDLLNANARLTAEIARVSGVVPQVAVVTGTCAGTNAINAAAADVCVMAEDAELFLNAPFNAEDKVANAGSAAFAAKAGVAAVTTADTVAAAKQAAPSSPCCPPTIWPVLRCSTLPLPPRLLISSSTPRPTRSPLWPMRAALWSCTQATAKTSSPRWLPSTAAPLVSWPPRRPLCAQVHRQGCPLRSSVRCLQHPRCDRRQHRGVRQERGRRSGWRHPSGCPYGRCLRRGYHRQGRRTGR